MKKGIIILLNDDTEEIFYNRLINQLRSFFSNERFAIDKLLIRNLKGIGNYKTKVKRILVNNIIANNPDTKFTVILCYDTVVSDFSHKPPVVWSDVEEDLKKGGAHKVIHIKAKDSIEDWFLFDVAGILRYLKLSPAMNISKDKGKKSIENLFREAEKVYIKGSQTEGFIDNLDVNIIMESICPDIKNLCKELGVKCTDSKCKAVRK